VTAVKQDFRSTSATSAAVPIEVPGTVPVPGSGALTTATPVISGRVMVGAQVSATPGAWTAGSAPVTSFTYQWLRNGAPIAGATAPTYAVARGDYGASLSVTVTGAYEGYPAASASSTPYPVAAGALTSARPKIAGKAKVGHRLTAKPGPWLAGGVTLSGGHLEYQWYANGKRIAGASHAAYLVGRSDKGKRITVQVSGSYPGYAPESETSKRTRAVTAH
jgi:hypothetical protein